MLKLTFELKDIHTITDAIKIVESQDFKRLIHGHPIMSIKIEEDV